MNPILLVGLPDSGKTNFLARLWIAMSSNGCKIVPKGTPEDIRYVESLVEHLLQGEFAPRSNKNEEPRPFAIDIVNPATSNVLPLIVPDVRGELWKDAATTTELPQEWMDRLKSCSSVLLLLRVHSELIVKPMDWVSSPAELRHTAEAPDDEAELPTQVLLCEIVRFLEHSLVPRERKKPRVAVLVTAWDLLDVEGQLVAPEDYIREQFPLLSGRLRDVNDLEVRVFGVSILGGDLKEDPAFKAQFVQSASPHERGYVVISTAEGNLRVPDMTLPLAWALHTT